MSQNPQNILVVRTDRIGDLVLSTPVFQAIKENFPNCKLTVLTSAYASEIIKTNPYVDEIIEYDPKKRFKGLTGSRKLSLILALRKFDLSIVLQTNFFVALAIYLAKIPRRIGPRSKFHSFLFYNDGLSQRRSRVEMHEADYNLQLLTKLGVQTTTLEVKPKVYLTSEQRHAADKYLTDNNLTSKPLVIMHPGMGHSALNWAKEHWIDLGKKFIANTDVNFILSMGQGEIKQLESISKSLDCIYYPGDKSLSFLAALYERAALVIAPSTGPLHIANGVGTPVLSFYPPIKVQSVLRWGPIDHYDDCLVPDVNCAEDMKCAGHKCRYYFCMRGIFPQEAYDRSLQILKRNKSNKTTSEISHETTTN